MGNCSIDLSGGKSQENIKAYHAWSYSNHKVFYTIGYFEYEKDAWDFLHAVLGPRSAADPECGVSEIEVIAKIKREDEHE